MCVGIKVQAKNNLITALQGVLNDESFKINSPATVKTRKAAESFLEWCLKDDNKDKLDIFTKQISKNLKDVIVSSKTKSLHYNKDKIWRGYFLLRTSESFIKQWTTFLATCTVPVEPVLYQHLTDILFRRFIHEHFEILHLEQGTSSEITHHEGNALRYAAGYVCRHLRKKIERENSEIKEELVLCLMELTKNRNSEEGCGTDEEWTNMIDRGGLWHVKETTFKLFCAIEDEVRMHLETLTGKTAAGKSVQGKAEIIRDITKSDDVQFYWLIATADFEIDDSEITDVLLYKIVELFLTIRGFSHTSTWMERYKQSTKEATQRSKSLRRELHDNSSK